jgi:hypothetical protein
VFLDEESTALAPAVVGKTTARDNGSELFNRKRSPAKTFEERHAANIANVYAVWDEKKDSTKPTKYWKALWKADQDAAKRYSKEAMMKEGDTIHSICEIPQTNTNLLTGEFH